MTAVAMLGTVGFPGAAKAAGEALAWQSELLSQVRELRQQSREELRDLAQLLVQLSHGRALPFGCRPPLARCVGPEAAPPQSRKQGGPPSLNPTNLSQKRMTQQVLGSGRKGIGSEVTGS